MPIWHQNGIITKYIVYFRIVGSSSRFDVTPVYEPARSTMIENLELWKIYDIYMTAFTQLGEGPNSTTIRVRTDEDSKYIFIIHSSEAFFASSSNFSLTYK